MNWGGSEGSWQLSYDSLLTSSYGATFFASSGDSGTSVPLIWPASSPNAVAVGGTTLNLASDGSVTSETAWGGSGGGTSSVEAKPNYQATYGLAGTGRCVPDVSYDADPATGFSVYCDGSWIAIGGTSAGAPQWAAIDALTCSVSNVNLYQKAKNAYSTYFRDITSGSNGAFTAASGYDEVTGLGSPMQQAKFGS
jgi:subtilase family serine protease